MRTREEKLAAHRRACKAYYERRRTDPSFMRTIADRAKKKRDELKHDPIYISKRRAWSLKRYYTKIKPDPTTQQKFRDGCTKNTRLYRERKQAIRIQLQALLGSKCSRCRVRDYRLLDFDHIDPLTKTMNISQKLHLPWETLVEEVKKCQLLCPNCHRLKTLEQGGFNSTIRQFKNPSKGTPGYKLDEN